MKSTQINLAVAGGRRGASFNNALAAFADRVRLAAVCDPDDLVRNSWAEEHPDIRTYAEIERMLDDPGIDAVLIATPMPMHARQAIQALDAGKHVLSEVIAAVTLEECWELVEAVERSGLTYMMAENYCYRREVMMVRNMADAGLFGDITFAEGAYIHDCRDLMIREDGSRTWRGIIGAGNTQLSRGNGYPTHSLGPVAQWLGINRSDRLMRTTTFVTKSAARHEWAMSVLPEGHADACPEAWADATDSASTIIETERGRVIVLRKDSASPRPHNMTHYGLQGTGGAFVSARHGDEDPLVWIDGLSDGASPHNAGYRGMARPDGHLDRGAPAWQSLWDLAGQYEDPRWKAQGEEAVRSGHGGGDYFVMEDFVNAVRDGTPPPIDIYDAVTWSCITPLSVENVRNNGVPLEIPDFKRGRG